MPVDQEEKRNLLRALYIPILLLCILWSIMGIEYLFGISFGKLGIYPHKLYGLPGILFSPLVHANLKHLFNNSIPLLILTTAIFYFYRPIALKILILIWLVTGLCVWIGARSAYHIGASGLIYGNASFLFFSGVIRKNIKLLAISLLTIFLYGGMVWGIFPIDNNISWESHLFGGLAGMTFAFIFFDEGPKKEEIDWEDDEDDDEFPYWEQTNFTESESFRSSEKFDNKTEPNQP
jgi:membrane associated rhomboid family serine protease